VSFSFASIIRPSISAGAYRVYGTEVARLLFGLGNGTGEPNALEEAEPDICTERTSEQSNPLCAVFFLEMFGAD
jgi:hypothetical protein